MARPKKKIEEAAVLPGGGIVSAAVSSEINTINTIELLNAAVPENENTIIITNDSTDSNQSIVSPQDNPPPKRTDPEWHDYVMGHFVEDEMINGKPNSAGLRRVFELLIGIPTSITTRVIQSPNTSNDNHAVVEVNVSYYDKSSASYLLTTISDAADVFIGNTAEPFYRHSVATASTIAESRCYRKALRLRVISADEDSQPKGEQAEIQNIIEQNTQNITPAQRRSIEVLSSKLGIKHIDKLLVVIFGQDSNKNLDNLSKDEAMTVLRQLNKYQNGPKKDGVVVPNELY